MYSLSLSRVALFLAVVVPATGFVSPSQTIRGVHVERCHVVGATASDEGAGSGRREVVNSLVLGGLAFLAPAAAQALDMDAFMNSEIEKDTKSCDPKKDPKCIPKLSADEALCKYGQSGNAKGEACKRVKAAGGALPEKQNVKSLGGAYAM